MHVLGSTNPIVQSCSFEANQLVAYTDPLSPFPRIICPGEHSITAQVIMFDRPSPARMQYMSLTPITLSLASESFSGGIPFDDRNGVELERIQRDANKANLIEKLRLHTVKRHSPSPKELMLPVVLHQINCSEELAQLLSKNSHLIGTRPKRSLSVSERVVESASTLWLYLVVGLWRVIVKGAYPIFTQAFAIGLICHRLVAEIILQALAWRPHPESAALKDISATAQQVDIRLQQFCYWPIQYITLRRRRSDWESITDRHPDYIRFYNSLWLVANDVIIGIALGSFIIDNADRVAHLINQLVSEYTVEGLGSIIEWLMGWPAGLKLNNELAGFLGDLFLWVIAFWAGRLTTPWETGST